VVEETSIVNDAQPGATENPVANLGASGIVSRANQPAPTANAKSETGASATLTIDKWVYGGEALARIDGRAVLAPFVLPGETVRLAVGEDVHAELREVVTPSPMRVAPPCPLFTRCGGCHYQHAPYAFQLSNKAEILREQIKRVGKIDYQGEIETVGGPPLGYRNRVQLHIDNGRLGYLAPRSHQLVPLDGECPVASPRLNQAIAEMRERLADRHFPRFVRSLELFTNETDLQVNVLESERPVAKRFYEWCGSVSELDYATSFATFRVSPRSFFQVNRYLVENLVDVALGDSAGGTALDLYAGVGLFALPLASRFQRVVAVEAGASATRDLAHNAARANVALVTVQSRVDDFLIRRVQEGGAPPDFVLADPPRVGLGKLVTTNLMRLAPPRITIVSCDPATLARDLAALPGYGIESLVMVDLFPHTYHLEAVAHLRKI